MKKITTLLLSGFMGVTMLCSCFPGLPFGNNAESEVESGTHTHVFGQWSITQEPTCQKKGTQTRVCACGEEEIYVLKKVSHSYGDDDRCVWCGIDVDGNLPEGDSSSEDPPNPDADAKIKLTAFDGAEVDVLSSYLRSYIDQRTDAKALAEILKTEMSSPRDVIKQNITFSWSKEGQIFMPYTLSVADNAGFDNAFEQEVSGTYCSSVGFFIPGLTYYWKVTSADGVESEVDTFVVKDAPTRAISAGSMRNLRDMGGWSVGEGKRVAYGKLYRGDDIRETGNAVSEKVLRYLGIHGEIDVRFNSTATRNFLNIDKPFLKAGLKYFSQNIPHTTVGEWAENNGDFPVPLTEVSANVGKIVKFLADESNYPVYLHCSWGKDRTGTICYILGGLLGMSYEDLMCDYEISSFVEGVGSQPRNEIVADPNGGWKFRDAKDDPWGAVGRVHYDITTIYPAASISESIAKYLTTECGVTEAEIAKVKENMLESI